MGWEDTILRWEWLVFPNMQWRDVLDIALMTFLVYQAYVRFRRTSAARVGVGLMVLGIGYFLAQAAGLSLTSWVLGGVWAAAFIFVVVVFQAEIRQVLAQVNPRLPSLAWLRGRKRRTSLELLLSTLAETCFRLAEKRYGALLVLEKRDSVEPFLRSQGVVVDARVSPQLLENLVTPPTPLHDGALYFRGERLYRAGCVLPLSESRSLPLFYGTRHRAALGITEHTDALAVVVSEERGSVSAVERGGMVMMPDAATLVSWLSTHLLGGPHVRVLPRSGLQLFTRHWQAKLGAFAVVTMLWLVLVGPQNTEVGLSVPTIYYNIPADLELVGERPQDVYLRLRGSRELLSLLDTRRLRAQIDLKDAPAGTTQYTLSAQDVNVPLGVQVAAVEPATLRVRLRKKPQPVIVPEGNGGEGEGQKVR
ncbi:MAG: diadenylate cyclase [Candidatus Binatia bacterium]